jgi:hypothetical protein
VNNPNGTFTQLTFSWNITSAGNGNYTISAYAWPVLDETYTADNLLIGGRIQVSIAGDLNGDSTVDIYDAITLSGAYNAIPKSSSWNPDADINNDNIIDLYDAIILAGNYGKTA